MRPIKFRAWDKEKNKMFEPTYRAYAGELEELLISLKGDLILRKIDKTIHESLFPNRFILMQSTGLLDKNGVEIYEGDVVTYKDNRGRKRIGKINYANAKYYIGNFETLGYAGERYELEVIGNIWEDGDLLDSE